jgi:hypothetical protein
MEIGYVVRDAKKWEVEMERDAFGEKRHRNFLLSITFVEGTFWGACAGSSLPNWFSQCRRAENIGE